MKGIPTAKHVNAVNIKGLINNLFLINQYSYSWLGSLTIKIGQINIPTAHATPRNDDDDFLFNCTIGKYLNPYSKIMPTMNQRRSSAKTNLLSPNITERML
jgi:hypothetical protein